MQIGIPKFTRRRFTSHEDDRISCGAHAGARVAFILFFVRLALNLGWSVVYGFEAPGWGLVEILVLWTAILLAVLAFHRVSRPAALLLVPYLVWGTFAASLNAGV